LTQDSLLGYSDLGSRFKVQGSRFKVQVEGLKIRQNEVDNGVDVSTDFSIQRPEDYGSVSDPFRIA
jgi:hypothetical protein